MINKPNNKGDVATVLADFSVGLRYEDLPLDVVAHLKNLLLDWIGVASAASKGADSSDPIVKGITAFNRGVTGTSTVLNRGQTANVQTAALLNGSFSHSFDFDDTHSRGALHPGASVVAAVLAQAEELQSSTKNILTALAVGYEVVCRVAVQLGDLAYVRGFHNTGTAGIFGSIAAISSLKKVSASVVWNAFGLAGSKAAGSMQFFDNGSWNKRLHPGFAAHDALLCVALAEAGVQGSSECFEGRAGLFHAYSGKKTDIAGITGNLGSFWEFMTTAMKPFPACRVTHGAIDMVGKLAENNPGRSFSNIDITLKDTSHILVGAPLPNRVHPQNIVDGQFSMYYQVAVAWLHGSWTGWEAYDYLDDPEVHRICDLVTVNGNGEGMNGLETKMVVTWEDGVKENLHLARPLGETVYPFTKSGIDAKFTGLAAPVYGERKAEEIKQLVDAFETGSFAGLMELVR